MHVSCGALPLSVVMGEGGGMGGGGGGREICKNIKCKDRQCLVVFSCHFFVLLGGGGGGGEHYVKI